MADTSFNASMKIAADTIKQKQSAARAHLRANEVPLDLTTGKPATSPPAGANVISPYAVGSVSAPDTSSAGAGKIGIRNESIYPEK